MSELKVFNKDVIPVYVDDNGRKTVIGRELHEGLKISERCSKWFDRMCSYGFTTNVDYTPYQMVHPQNNQEIEDHILTLDMAKHIAMIQRTPEGKAIRDQLIKLETDISELSPELRLLISMELKQKEQARMLAEHEQELKSVNQKIDGIRDVVALHPKQWREECRKLLAKVAEARGGGGAYQDVNTEVYQLVNERGRYDLKRRLENLKSRLMMEGEKRSVVNKKNYLDVIEQDKRITEIYVAIVKEIAVKYGVA